MADLFVDNVDGNDTYNGSYARFKSGSDGPKKTLQAAANAIPNNSGGHNIYVAPRGNPGTLNNLAYAGTSGAWNQVIGDTNVEYTDPDGVKFDCTPGPCIAVGRVDVGGTNNITMHLGTNSSYCRISKMIAVNPGYSGTDWGILIQNATEAEIVDCIGISPRLGIALGAVAGSPAEGLRVFGSIGIGTPGFYCYADGVGTQKILIDDCHAVQLGFTGTASYLAAIFLDTCYAKIRHTSIATGLQPETYEVGIKGGAGAGGKAEIIRCVAQAGIATETLASGSSATDCYHFGTTGGTGWTNITTPPFLQVPLLYKGGPINDVLSHLAGLTGKSAFDIMGFDRSSSSQTPGAIEYRDGKQVAGYPGYNTRGATYIGDLVAAASGGMSPIYTGME